MIGGSHFVGESKSAKGGGPGTYWEGEDLRILEPGTDEGYGRTPDQCRVSPTSKSSPNRLSRMILPTMSVSL